MFQCPPFRNDNQCPKINLFTVKCIFVAHSGSPLLAVTATSFCERQVETNQDWTWWQYYTWIFKDGPATVLHTNTLINNKWPTAPSPNYQWKQGWHIYQHYCANCIWKTYIDTELKLQNLCMYVHLWQWCLVFVTDTGRWEEFIPLSGINRKLNMIARFPFSIQTVSNEILSRGTGHSFESIHHDASYIRTFMRANHFPFWQLSRLVNDKSGHWLFQSLLSSRNTIHWVKPEHSVGHCHMTIDTNWAMTSSTLVLDTI